MVHVVIDCESCAHARADYSMAWSYCKVWCSICSGGMQLLHLMSQFILWMLPTSTLKRRSVYKLSALHSHTWHCTCTAFVVELHAHRSVMRIFKTKTALHTTQCYWKVGSSWSPYALLCLYLLVYMCTGALHHLSDCVKSTEMKLPFGIAQTGTYIATVLI